MTHSAATLEALISFALAEDLSDRGDVTTQALIDPSEQTSIAIRSRCAGVLAGSEAATKTLHAVDSTLSIQWTKTDGDVLEAGGDIATVSGSAASILTAERTTLNFLQHLSGIASLTRMFVDAVRAVGSTTIVRDTRKTLPGYRALEKAAVVAGGGQNHRMGLYDAFLVKDNHLAGHDLEIIAQRCRDFDPSLPLEIEVDSLSQLKVVIDFNPDVILLDNFSIDDVYSAIEMVNDIDLEVSGGISIENVADYAKTNVKYISIGALTHSAPALDLGFDAI
jgi:nicotinate-nucleotide pyrophosphorylase (carboxylating)